MTQGSTHLSRQGKNQETMTTASTMTYEIMPFQCVPDFVGSFWIQRPYGAESEENLSGNLPTLFKII